MSVSEKRDVIITYSRERLNVRIGSTLSQSLLKRSCLSDSQKAPGRRVFCVCLKAVITGLRHPSAGFPLPLRLPTLLVTVSRFFTAVPVAKVT